MAPINPETIRAAQRQADDPPLTAEQVREITRAEVATAVAALLDSIRADIGRSEQRGPLRMPPAERSPE